jgi:YihY family inner membrane protein
MNEIGNPLKRIANIGARAFTYVKRIIGKAFQKYGQINGEQCAASFAYYAFFSLFPLILLLVAVGTFFIPDRHEAERQVVRQVEQYIPLQAKDRALISTTLDDAIQNGWRAGILGLLALVWGGLRFFQALVIGINRAWGAKDYNWWKLPLKNLFMIGILVSALVLGLIVPLILDRVKAIHFLDINVVVDLLSHVLPPAILFYGLSMLYKFAPRKSVLFRYVWFAAFLGTIFLQFGQQLFAWYLDKFTHFNALYGVFGTIMGLLLWIYYSGTVLLLGGCISATIGDPGRAAKSSDTPKSQRSLR